MDTRVNHSVISRIKNNISKIQHKLEQKYLASLKADSVMVRDIIVNQYSPSEPQIYGEFYENPETIIDKEKVTYREDESDDDLIERIFKQIEELAFFAADKHIKDNFTPKPKTTISQNIFSENSQKKIHRVLMREWLNNNDLTMKPGSHDHITHLVTSEFFFYPNQERGPINAVYFEKLLEKIKALGKALPENLYLNLGTFPVTSDNSTFDNISLFVICGNEPKIHTHAKTFAFESDPFFPNLSNSSKINFPHQLYSISFITNQGLTKLYELLNDFDQSDPEGIIQIANILKDACQNFSYFIAPDHLINGLDIFIHAIQNNSINASSAQTYIQYFYNEFVNYENLRNQTFENFNRLYSPQQRNSHFHTSANGKNLTYQTLNMVDEHRFGFITEICIDHQKKVAKLELEEKIRRARENPNEILPIYISHIIQSNSTRIKEQAVLTNDNSTTFADPDFFLSFTPNEKEDESKEFWTDNYFNNDISVITCKPKKLSLLKDKFLKQITHVNVNNIRLRAMNLYRDHHSHDFTIVSQLIQLELHQQFIDDLKLCLASQPTNLTEQIILGTLREATELAKDIDLFLEKFIDFLDKKINILIETKNKLSDEATKLNAHGNPTTKTSHDELETNRFTSKEVKKLISLFQAYSKLAKDEFNLERDFIIDFTKQRDKRESYSSEFFKKPPRINPPSVNSTPFTTPKQTSNHG